MFKPLPSRDVREPTLQLHQAKKLPYVQDGMPSPTKLQQGDGSDLKSKQQATKTDTQGDNKQIDPEIRDPSHPTSQDVSNHRTNRDRVSNKGTRQDVIPEEDGAVPQKQLVEAVLLGQDDIPGEDEALPLH